MTVWIRCNICYADLFENSESTSVVENTRIQTGSLYSFYDFITQICTFFVLLRR